jgi:hypothetical protein
LSRRILVLTAVTAILIVMSLSGPSQSWAQEGIPIGTVPLFPPASGAKSDIDEVVNDSLVQLNLASIELSKDVEANGIGGRSAIRSGLHLTLSDKTPQKIHLPVQLFGETVLATLTDRSSGIIFVWDELASTGKLTIPFGDETGQGSALITTGQMVASGNSVSAEVYSVLIAVGDFDLDNETQIGGSADILFAGGTVPETLLVGLTPLSTTEVASYWGESYEDSRELVLVDVLASAAIEAGFIGRFDGVPTLNLKTTNSWRSSGSTHEVHVLGITNSDVSRLLTEGDYLSSSEGERDIYSFTGFSEISRFAIVLVKQKLQQPVVDSRPTAEPMLTAEPTPSAEPTLKSPTQMPTISTVITPVNEPPKADEKSGIGSGTIAWLLTLALLIVGGAGFGVQRMRRNLG